MELWPGRPFPLGPIWGGNGTNFSLFTENADRGELCLFDRGHNTTPIQLTEAEGVQRHCNTPLTWAG